MILLILRHNRQLVYGYPYDIIAGTYSPIYQNDDEEMIAIINDDGTGYLTMNGSRTLFEDESQDIRLTMDLTYTCNDGAFSLENTTKYISISTGAVLDSKIEEENGKYFIYDDNVILVMSDTVLSKNSNRIYSRSVTGGANSVHYSGYSDKGELEVFDIYSDMTYEKKTYWNSEDTSTYDVEGGIYRVIGDFEYAVFISGDDDMETFKVENNGLNVTNLISGKSYSFTGSN